MADKTGWAVVSRNGHIITSTLANKRRTAIERMVGDEGDWQWRWRYWKRNHGCRCVRVTIKELRP